MCGACRQEASRVSSHTQDLPFLCIGAAHRDIFGRAFVSAGVGADLPGKVWSRPGGVALNVALALAAENCPVRLLAIVGDDGDPLLSFARRRGVDCTSVLREPGPGDCYVAVEDAAGELVAAVADCRMLDRKWPALVEAAGRAGPAVRIVDSNLPAEALARIAAVAGPLVVVSASPAKSRAFRPLLERSDTRFYLNRAEGEALAEEPFEAAAQAVERLAALGAAVVVVTDASRAAAAGGQGQETIVRVPSSGSPARMGGATGAGDRLVAAHLAACAAGAAAEAALERGLAAATRHFGGEDRA